MADQIVSWGGFNSKGTSGMGVTGSFQVSSSANSFFVGGGNVGIGTSNPTSSLDVFKNNAGNIQTGNDSVIVKGNNPRLKILGTSAGSSTGDGVIQFSTEDSGDRWVITGGGTFAIGAGWYNSNTSLFRITNSSGGNTAASIFLANADNDGRFALGFAGTNGTPLSGFTSTGKLYISSTGLATPSAMLQVKGTGTTSSTTSFLVQNSTPTTLLQVEDGGTTRVTGPTPQLMVRVPSNQTPSSALTVGGNALFTYDGYSNAGGFYIDQGGTSNASRTIWYDGSGTSKNLITGNGNNYITSGNVGIGTSSPSASLHVTGSTLITGSLTFNGSDLSTAWTSYTPTWTSDGTAPSLGDGTLTGAYKVIGKTCFVRVRLVYGSSTTSGTGAFYFDLPFSASAASGVQFPCSILDNGNAWYQATVNGEYGGFTNKTAIIGQSSGANSSQGITGTFPFTFGTSDSIQFNGSYEIA